MVTFFCHQLGACACRTNHLSALADFQFHIMYHSTKRNIDQRQAIADFNIGFRTAGNDVSHLQSLWRKDIALLTICIVQERDTASTVRIIFNCCHRSRNIVFHSLEINDSVLTFMTTALMADCHLAGAIATTMVMNRSQKRFFWFICCNFLKGRYGHLAASGGVRFK